MRCKYNYEQRIESLQRESAFIAAKADLFLRDSRFKSLSHTHSLSHTLHRSHTSRGSSTRLDVRVQQRAEQYCMTLVRAWDSVRVLS